MDPLLSLRGSLRPVVLAALVICLPLGGPAAAGPETADSRLAQVLSVKMDLGVLNVPLDSLVGKLERRLGISIRLDHNGLRRANVAVSTRVTASLVEIPVRVILREILSPLRLQARVIDEVVVIEDTKTTGSGVPVGRGQPDLTAADKLRGEKARAVDWPRILRNFLREARTSLRPVLQVEVAFVESTCSPPPDEMRQLKQARSQQLEEIAQELRGDQFDFDDPWSDLRPLARQCVQRKVASWVHAHLSPVQVNRYETAIEKRNANLRNVIARNLVAAIDRELFLSAEQRQKLGAALADKWDAAWTMTVVHGLTTPPALPKIPDDLILPYLDSGQKQRWIGLAKVDHASWGLPDDALLGMHPVLNDKD